MFFSGLRKLLIFLISPSRRSTAVSQEIYLIQVFCQMHCSWKLLFMQISWKMRSGDGNDDEYGLAGWWPLVCVIRISGCSKLVVPHRSSPQTTKVLFTISKEYISVWYYTNQQMHCKMNRVHCTIVGWAMLDEWGLPGADLPIELFHPPPSLTSSNDPTILLLKVTLKYLDIFFIFDEKKYSTSWCWANMGELGKLCWRQTFVLKTTFKSHFDCQPCASLTETWHKLCL